MPEIVTIRTPVVGDVGSVEMKVLCTPACGKGKGLYMELSTANLDYVANVCAASLADAAEFDDPSESASHSSDPPSDPPV